jgi:pyruvate/2-oxoglutarate dehydrogenase complex dihydrolipoamide dehydrogenase (E3) component
MATVAEQAHRIGARCRDGSESAATGRGACSRHGGVPLKDVASAASTVHGWNESKQGVNVFGQSVIVTDEQIADLRRRAARLRGDDVSDGLTE